MVAQRVGIICGIALVDSVGASNYTANGCAPIGPGCCQGTTLKPASEKIVDGPGYTPDACKAACTNGCNYYTFFPTGWCTAWKAGTTCDALATDAVNCGSIATQANTYKCGSAPSKPTCSSGKFSWNTCDGHRTCKSPTWDGCAESSCESKIPSGAAINVCRTLSNTIGCNYGSDDNTCAYDKAGNCCYSGTGIDNTVVV